MVDCLVTGNVAVGGNTGGVRLEQGATMSILRTAFRDNRGTTGPGCFELYSSTLSIDDSDISNCWAGSNGMMMMDSSHVTITNSRMAGNGAAGKAGLIGLYNSGSFLRITDSTITDTSSGVGEFAIVVDDVAPDFSLQLDTVSVDGSIDIYSHSEVLLQNCEGFNGTAVQNASVGTCQSGTDFCLAESCSDMTVGIDCICEVASGEQVVFPTDCMQARATRVSPRFAVNSSRCHPSYALNSRPPPSHSLQ